MKQFSCKGGSGIPRPLILVSVGWVSVEVLPFKKLAMGTKLADTVIAQSTRGTLTLVTHHILLGFSSTRHFLGDELVTECT